MRYLPIFFLVALLHSPAARAVDMAPAAGTAALVNGSVITTADYRAELDRVLRQRNITEKDMDPTALLIMKKEAMDTLIGRELMYQESCRKGGKIPPAAIEAEIVKLRKQYSSEEDYTLSLAKLGLSEDILKLQIEKGMAIQKQIESEFSSKTPVSTSEARNYYDSHQKEFLQSSKVTEGRLKVLLPFENVREKIIKQLRRERTLDDVTRYQKRLRDAARVEIHLTEE